MGGVALKNWMEFAQAIHACVARGWQSMRSKLRLQQVPVRPPEPKALVEKNGAMSFSLYSSTASLGNPASLGDEILRQQQRHFQAGHLFHSLRTIPEHSGVLIAHIEQQGSSPGFHLLAVFPTVDRFEAGYHPADSGVASPK